ncbi:MAG: hypothetical protein JXL84_17105 [Deltaproteobacteria bacterium]|nr:hypothetical protein [Deltaproteobacteria bacterium]
MAEKFYADSLDSLKASLPPAIGPWKPDGEDRVFDDKTIFDYIDGAGEVYRAYHMRRCLSRRYASSHAPAIILDIFDMGSSKDAYGVFTHDRDGDPVDLGQEGLYRAGWLRFWKDRFFVSIFDEAQTVDSREAAKGLGNAVAALIGRIGERPRLVEFLPAQGLQARSIRYLHDHIILNTHFYVSDENILRLGSLTEAALATYQRGTEDATLLLISYPDADKSTEAFQGFLRHYLSDADSLGFARMEDGKWAAAALKGSFMGIVLEARSRQLAADLLSEAMNSASRSGSP